MSAERNLGAPPVQPGPSVSEHRAGLRQRSRGRWGRAVGMVVALAVAGFLARYVVGDYRALAKVNVALRPGWLVLAVPCSVVAGLALALGWRRLLSAWGASIGRATALRVWWRSQASRYLPTGAFAVASREVLAGRAGVPRALGAASNVVELGVLLGWGAVVTGVALPSPVLPVAARILVGAAGALALVILPWGMRLAAALLPRLAPRLVARLPALAGTGASPTAVYRACALYGVSAIVNTAAFVLLAAGMLDVHPVDVALLAGAVQGASIIGVLSVAPAGVGVREAMLVVLLGPRFGAGNALALAGAWRAWALAFELVWLMIGSGASHLGRRGLALPAK